MIDKKLVLAIIPFGVTGSGKSTFLKTLTEIVKRLKWTINSVSSDGVRGEHMKKYQDSHPGVSAGEAFDKTAKTAVQDFGKRVERMIRESDKSPAPVHILFIDKNHPPNGIDKTITTINQLLPLDCVVKRLYLVPKILSPMRDYPFS